MSGLVGLFRSVCVRFSCKSNCCIVRFQPISVQCWSRWSCSVSLTISIFNRFLCERFHSVPFSLAIHDLNLGCLLPPPPPPWTANIFVRTTALRHWRVFAPLAIRLWLKHNVVYFRFRRSFSNTVLLLCLSPLNNLLWSRKKPKTW